MPGNANQEADRQIAPVLVLEGIGLVAQRGELRFGLPDLVLHEFQAYALPRYRRFPSLQGDAYLVERDPRSQFKCNPKEDQEELHLRGGGAVKRECIVTRG